MFIYLSKAQWEYFLHGSGEWRMGVLRLIGIEATLNSPNSLACTIVLTLPFLIFLWNIRKEFTATWPPFYKTWFPRFLFFYALLAISSIGLTNSRSGMLGFLFFLFLFGLLRGGVKNKFIYLIFILFFLAFLWEVMPEDIQGRFMTIWNPELGPKNAQTSAEGRIEGLLDGIALFKLFPFSGVGIGNFIENRVYLLNGPPLQAHNLAGQILGETGLLGTFSFLVFLFAAFIGCSKIKTKYREPIFIYTLFNQFSFACRDGLLLLLFFGLPGHNLLRFNWYLFAIFVSIAISLFSNLRDVSQVSQ
ncbi:MAG: O-antigen ligase family protein [Pseudomonadota bacterium]